MCVNCVMATGALAMAIRAEHAAGEEFITVEGLMTRFDEVFVTSVKQRFQQFAEITGGQVTVPEEVYETAIPEMRDSVLSVYEAILSTAQKAALELQIPFMVALGAEAVMREVLGLAQSKIMGLQQSGAIQGAFAIGPDGVPREMGGGEALMELVFGGVGALSVMTVQPDLPETDVEE